MAAGALGAELWTEGCSVQACAANDLGIPDFDLEVKTSSGNRLWVNISTIVFDEPTRWNRRLVVHVARDISQRKTNEQLLVRMLALSKELVGLFRHVDGISPVSPLSTQEQRILRLFAKAKNAAEIARELSITFPTPRNHLHSINEKLLTHNRLEARCTRCRAASSGVPCPALSFTKQMFRVV